MPRVQAVARRSAGERLLPETLGRIDGLGHRIPGDRTGHSNKRGTGWEHLHIAVDDASRLACTALLPDERGESAANFPRDALAWFAAHGISNPS